MPLILAIEPERQQAALLSSLVRGRLSAELVLADTTEQAVVAIGDRVPDLVLIPTLLSAQEDAALAGALRMIAAAANVQMLTIPLLAAPAPVERRGVLAKWRRGKQAVPTAAGCDPAVFAEQIASYLADNGEPTTGDSVVGADAPAPVVLETLVESAAETSEVEARGPSDVVDARVESPVMNYVAAAAVEAPEVSAPVSYLPRPFALIDWQGAPSASAPTVTPVISVVVAEVEGAEEVETGPVTELIDEPIVQAVAQPLEAAAVRPPSLEALVVEDAEQLIVAPPSETVLVVDEALTASIQEPAIELFAAPRIEQLAEVVVEFDETPIYEMSFDELASDAALMASIDAMIAASGQSSVVSSQSSAVRDQSPVVSRQESVVSRESTVAMPLLVPQEIVDTPAAIMAVEASPAIEPVVDVRVPQPPPAAVVAAVAAGTPAKPERPEWVELIESLRQDIERLKAERISPISVAAPLAEGPTAIPAPDAGSPTPVVSGVRTPKRPTVVAKKAPRPAQDEWGLFEPDQCGFASLLAKLSEITEGNDGGGSPREINH